MKSIIYTLFILNQSLIFAQDSTPNEIKSIGKFEINTTTISVISELEKELKSKVKICNSSSDDFKYRTSKENYIIQLLRDTVNRYNSPVRSSYCDVVKVYSVGGYSIADIELDQLVLTFLNDTLVKLSCDATSKFKDAISLKYGKGKLRKTEKEVTCEVGRLGTEVRLKETSIYESWGESDIIATSAVSVYYNSKCEKQYMSYFTLESMNAIRIISNCEDLKKEEIKKLEENQRKKLLNGF